MPRIWRENPLEWVVSISRDYWVYLDIIWKSSKNWVFWGKVEFKKSSLFLEANLILRPASPPSFPHTVHGRNPATWWLHHIVRFFFWTTTISRDIVHGQSSRYLQTLQVSSYHGYYTHGFDFVPTTTSRVNTVTTNKARVNKVTPVSLGYPLSDLNKHSTLKDWDHFPKKNTPRQKMTPAHRQVARCTPYTLAKN